MPSETLSTTPANPAPSKLHVVMFSGGSGTHSITQTLAAHPQISLRIVINAYDDGHSTGRLRRFIPSMLGPSDVRKNFSRLMPSEESGQRALKALSDFRLPVGISSADALSLIARITSGEDQLLPTPLCTLFAQLNLIQSRRLVSFLATFTSYFHQQAALNRHFDFTDCALGNLFFAGCYLESGEDFNRAIAAFSLFHDVDPKILLNVTLGENLFLVAEKEDGSILRNEADIVAAQSTDAKIAKLYLLDASIYLPEVESASVPPAEGWPAFLSSHHIQPAPNQAALDALAHADVVIYGPGTQHSSLLPSYLTGGIGEAIAANRDADKIFVANIHRDFDIPADDINDLARKFLDAHRRNGAQPGIEWDQVVSHFFVQADTAGDDNRAKYIPFDASKFIFPLRTVRLRDWEAQEGRHSGGFVLDEVRQIVQGRIDINLDRLQHMVSIIIPVLNEERTIEQVLREIVALDFQSLGLSKEIIVVDGASTDRSFEIAQSVRSVKVLRLDSQKGRGAALRMGIDAARGNLIAFFPGDNEYRTDDLISMVSSLTQSRFRAVFGSRAVKCTNLSGELHSIYKNQVALYLASKYGGMLLSILTLLLYNRYITDALSSVKAFDTDLLRSLKLVCDGRDLDTEIIAKLAIRLEYVLEIPVDYAPRTRSAGKKITVFDGLQCIWSLLRSRFSN